MAEYTDTIVIKGDECDYDPLNHVARILCENCGVYNEVEVWIKDGEPEFFGFVCEKCAHWNAPGE